MIQARCHRLAGVAVILAGCCTGIAGAQTVTQTTGPDIIVCSFPDVSNNATATIGGVVYDSFCVGTTSANRGNVPVNWWNQSTDNRHPAIAQNLFRYVPSTGRFEQLGQGSLKHGFTALQQNDCASPNYFNFGCTSTAGTTLGTGCADPYCCGLNNVLGSGGPKWQVNAATGLFAFPVSTTFQANSGPPRARLTDLQGAPAGTRYFMEGQYIVGDDAAANNKNNNASWQEVTMSPAAPAPTATNFTIALTGSIHREQPAIYAWQVIDPAVQIFTYDVPSDGRFILACKVSGPVGGLYTYEYALHNLNSNRCAGSLVVPLPGTQAALTNVGFHDVEAVSEPNQLGNPADPASDDWLGSGTEANSAAVSWSGPSYAGTLAVYTMDPVVPYKVMTFTPGTGNDHSANVLRWGTMFNFRFTSEVAPASTGQIAIGLWRPGTGTAFVMNNVPTPGGATVGALTAACCNATNCTVATQTDCGGGLWGLPGSSCSPNPCINGACCLPDLTCSQYNTTNCTAQGGAYQGDGSSCSGNPCPTGACCNNTTGGCTVGGSSCPIGSTYMGAHTACATTACPMGACCNNSSGACTVGGNACPAGRTFMGAGSLCGSVTCSVTEYCMAGADNCATPNDDERISEVIFNTIDNVSGTGSGPAGCYSDFRALSTSLVPGQAYPITVRNAGVYSGDQAAVWIDWNRNLAFLDSGEQFTLTAAGSAATFTGTVTVPAGAAPGSTRMRVRVMYLGTLSPCDGSTYGEVEDYTVNVLPSGTCCVGGTCKTTVAPGNCTAAPSTHAGAVFVPRAGGTAACNTAGTYITPCCYADYNKTGGISVQDIFDFLSDWFAGSPQARVGGDGTGPAPTVQSLFDFLGAWFAGGC